VRDTQTKETKNGAGYLSYEEYYATWEDEMPMHDFERLNRMASSMVDCLASRFVDGNDHHVKDAVSWQIWFMRQKGSLSACFEKKPLRESFADYAIERSGEGGIVRLLGVELCPMTLQLLRAGGVVTTWI
jgi:hypothetical protein